MSNPPWWFFISRNYPGRLTPSILKFEAFSSREQVSTSLENAIQMKNARRETGHFRFISTDRS
jgi:hypothetical protein